jgi:hypothetical protein
LTTAFRSRSTSFSGRATTALRSVQG